MDDLMMTHNLNGNKAPTLSGKHLQLIQNVQPAIKEIINSVTV